MTSTPVLSRDRIAEVVVEALSFEERAARGHLLVQQGNRVAHHLLTAGLFRPLPTREQIAEAMHNSEMLHKRGDDCPPACDVFLRRADAVLVLLNGSAAPTQLCGATNPRARGECVFIAGHHNRDADDWTPHGNYYGWTWNDQPAEDAS